MAKHTRPEPVVAKELRKMIVKATDKDSGLSRNMLCRKAEIDPSVLVKFINEGSGLTLNVAGALCEALDVELVIEKKKGKK